MTPCPSKDQRTRGKHKQRHHNQSPFGDGWDSRLAFVGNPVRVVVRTCATHDVAGVKRDVAVAVGQAAEYVRGSETIIAGRPGVAVVPGPD